jgi:hypothetical protein
MPEPIATPVPNSRAVGAPRILRSGVRDDFVFKAYSFIRPAIPYGSTPVMDVGRLLRAILLIPKRILDGIVGAAMAIRERGVA